MNVDAAREKLARFLCERQNGSRGWDYEPGRRYWLEDADALLPIVREIAAEELRAAAEAEAKHHGVPAANRLRDRAWRTEGGQP